MDTQKVVQEALSQLEAQGYKGRIASVQHLADLQEEVEAHRRRGLLDEGLYQEYLARLTFHPPQELPEARSLFIVAVPHPPTRVTLAWEGREVPITVPPTYLRSRDVDAGVGELLAQTLRPHGYRVAPAIPPKKLLGVHSGLAAYGKNNLCYVEGMGSFARLAAFCSDLPVAQAGWARLRMMSACESCSACLRQCPTGAIAADRILVHAERCLTFLNEKPGEVPFPAGIEPAWHNALVGCMRCQTICPQNRAVLSWVEEGPGFSQEETALLLKGVPLAQLPGPTADKLERSGLSEFVDLLPRNLGVLLGQEPRLGHSSPWRTSP